MAHSSFLQTIEGLLENTLQDKPAPAPAGRVARECVAPEAQSAASLANVKSSASGDMVLYTEFGRQELRVPGLGAVQPNGRSLVMQQWCSRPEQAQQQVQSSRSRTLDSRGSVRVGQASALPEAELEWSTLSEGARQALRQWVAGQLGGRHCMLNVEHSASADSVFAPLTSDKFTASNLRGGAALNVLSGLQAEVELIGSQEGSWLFEAVFAKTPAQVLDEALRSVVEEIGDPHLEHSNVISAEQANLALRRRSMKAQCSFPQGGGKEYMRTQVWLELLRQHVEGPREGGAQALITKDKAATPKEKAPPLHDTGVLRDLVKSEEELEVDSQQMTLEVLRAQNRSIEEYVMRLVRQRDELRQVTKIAEERDSYFVLGLQGPDSTEDEVKKAYRALARKEHPDKAGIGSKKRFQAIQQAYSSVMRRMREGCSHSMVRESGLEKEALDTLCSLGSTVEKAAAHAWKATEAADRVAICAHRSLRGGEDGVEAQSMPKRKALRVLRELTKQGSIELQIAATDLRALGDTVCRVARYAEEAMSEHDEWATTALAGVGLRDRAIIADDAGRSNITTAELLERIAEATEATLKKVERASPEAAGGPREEAPALASTRGGRDEALNLQRIGVRLLTESIARTAAVARRSAEEAIGAAMKACELSRSLAALDLEARKERERTAARRSGFDDDDVVAARDAPPRTDRHTGSTGPGGDRGEDSSGTRASQTLPHSQPETAGIEQTPSDKLESTAKRVKERHISLRVKNLRFLANLNEESLRLQGRLRALLERSEGALLPEVTIAQKGCIFDLVAQVLEFAVAESARLAASPNAPPMRVLERSLNFALALEHAKEIAMPVESRTQALKLAAFIDADLLCQIIEGPFRKRLLNACLGKRRTEFGAGLLRLGRLRSNSPGMKGWDEAIHACCARMVRNVRNLMFD